MPTEKLEKYYRDYKSGKLIGYAEEYSAYIEQILLERRNNQTNSQTQVVTVSEDEDPFSSANDDDWDNMIEEQEKRNKTPHQIDDDEEDGFILENWYIYIHLLFIKNIILSAGGKTPADK